MIWPILEVRAEILQIFCWLFGKFKTPKFTSEIIWPLLFHFSYLKTREILYHPCPSCQILLGYLVHWKWNQIEKSITSEIQSSSFCPRYRPRFFDQVGHQTTSAYIENKHYFTKACHHQTYQNSKISWQKMPVSDFQSEFSMSKIIRIFPLKNTN